MNTTTLRCIVHCDLLLSQQVVGIFAADEIPKQLYSFPSGLIINSDKSSGPGTHWLAFYLTSQFEVEFFDSYGYPITYYLKHIPDLINRDYSTKLKYNERRLQSYDSNACGHYCIFYLMNRCRGVSMDNIVGEFSDNYIINDTYVIDVIKSTFPFCINKEKLYKYRHC